MLRLNENHKYFLGDTPIPGVNEILESMGFIDLSGVPVDLLAEKSELGTLVHELSLQDDLGILSLENIEPHQESALPYIVAYRAFKEEYKPVYVKAEEPVWSECGFCGTPDRVTEDAIYDLKTSSSIYRYTRLQTAGYAILEGVTKRYAVYLKPDGSYTVKEHTDNSDLEIFLSLVTAFHWKKPRYSKGKT